MGSHRRVRPVRTGAPEVEASIEIEVEIEVVSVKHPRSVTRAPKGFEEVAIIAGSTLASTDP